MAGIIPERAVPCQNKNNRHNNAAGSHGVPGRGPRGSSRGKREEEPVGDGARAAVARAVEDLALGEERRAAAAVELRRVGAAFGGEERKR